MAERTNRIAIVGAGSVGATIAYACMIRGVGQQIVLFDINQAKVEAEVLDLNHGLQFVPMASVEGSNDLEICRGADVIVITAGAKQKPGQTRIDLASANVELSRTLVPPLVELAPAAILLLVTNPVDVVTYVALQLSGLPSSRVFGSGTVLDSSRFRYLLARHCRVAVQNVHAYMAGEHGDSEIPLWSSASIGTIPLLEWKVPRHGRLRASDREAIAQEVKTAAYRIIEGKGATNYAVGLAVARILEAVLKDEKRVLPVSSCLIDYRGISDVCLSVPSIVDRSGVDAVLPIPMSPDEEEGLQKSGEGVRATIRSLGF